MLLLPWRSFPTRVHANTRKMVLCEGKCNPTRISSRFSCILTFSDFCKRGNKSKNTHTLSAIDCCGCQSKEKALFICNLCATFINSENSQASLFGSSSLQFGKRALISCTLAALLTCGCVHFDNLPPSLQNSPGLGVAHASLVQMPPEFLNNRYYLVRAGESEFERIGIINTNPVAKTNVESGLSENGKKQTVKAALQLREMGACDASCWIWPSITQRAYQAAEIIAYVNNINRSRIVPEYSFLDARGLGAYEGKSLSYLSKIYELDAESTSLRPPPYTDGTPNESVADVFVRVTQLMSVLETQYFAESVIIVAPDSDNLSILQAALTGLDLRRHSELAYLPGEVRYVDLDDRPPQPRARPSGLVKCETKSQCG